MISKAFDAIKKYDVIIIHRHSNPDGDAMGSQIGLKRVLQVNFPDKKIYAVGDDARRFHLWTAAKWTSLTTQRTKVRWQSCWTRRQNLSYPTSVTLLRKRFCVLTITFLLRTLRT